MRLTSSILAILLFAAACSKQETCADRLGQFNSQLNEVFGEGFDGDPSFLEGAAKIDSLTNAFSTFDREGCSTEENFAIEELVAVLGSLKDFVLAMQKDDFDYFDSIGITSDTAFEEYMTGLTDRLDRARETLGLDQAKTTAEAPAAKPKETQKTASKSKNNPLKIDTREIKRNDGTVEHVLFERLEGFEISGLKLGMRWADAKPILQQEGFSGPYAELDAYTHYDADRQVFRKDDRVINLDLFAADPSNTRGENAGKLHINVIRLSRTFDGPQNFENWRDALIERYGAPSEIDQHPNQLKLVWKTRTVPYKDLREGGVEKCLQPLQIAEQQGCKIEEASLLEANRIFSILGYGGEMDAYVSGNSLSLTLQSDAVMEITRMPAKLKQMMARYEQAKNAEADLDF